MTTNAKKMNDKEKILIRSQRQRWPDFDRIVITAISETVDPLGTVQLELYPTSQWFGGTAYLYALWVSPDYRRGGVAKVLMRTAEVLTSNEGHKSITLEWDIREAPQWVRQWYTRLGYEDIETRLRKSTLMSKQL